MAKGKFQSGALSLDPALAGLAELQAKRNQESAEIDRMAKGEPEPKEEKAEKKPVGEKQPQTGAPKTKKAEKAQARVIIEKPAPQETKRAALCMRIKQSELDAWQKAAKANDVSLTYLVEYVMNKYIKENGFAE